MSQPPVFIDPTYPTYVCNLEKHSTQAPHAGYTKLRNFLLSMGFFNSLSDPSLFTYSHAGVAYLLVYGDNLVLIGNNNSNDGIHLAYVLVFYIEEDAVGLVV